MKSVWGQTGGFIPNPKPLTLTLPLTQSLTRGTPHCAPTLPTIHSVQAQATAPMMLHLPTLIACLGPHDTLHIPLYPQHIMKLPLLTLGLAFTLPHNALYIPLYPCIRWSSIHSDMERCINAVSPSDNSVRTTVGPGLRIQV